jgi:hypothetical protein
MLLLSCGCDLTTNALGICATQVLISNNHLFSCCFIVSGFFVCKLKKLSDKKVAVGGNEPEDVEQELEMNMQMMDADDGDGLVPNFTQRNTSNRDKTKGKQQKKLESDHGENGDNGIEEKAHGASEEKIKKKREPGIVKRARAELLAEMASKQAKTATAQRAKTQKKKKTASRKI